jgi:hypothetical protein
MRRALLIGALTLALGGLLGRLSADDVFSSPTPSAVSPGPTREGAGGVGLGYAHTRTGALAASARFQQAFADPAILRRGELRRRIEAVATPAYVSRMLAANEVGAERLAQGILGDGVRADLPTAYFKVPVYHQFLSYSPQRAIIRLWGFTVVGNASTAEPAAYFGTARMALAWQDGDWRIEATRAAFGPTPRLLTPRRGGEGFDLIDLLEEMKPYAVAP